MTKAKPHSTLFLIGLGIRFLFLFGFGSHYLFDFFMPFLDSAVLNITANPWAHSPPEFFPYGAFLYGLLVTPKYLAYLLVGGKALGASPLSVFLVKIVLLGFDCLLYRLIFALSVPDQKRPVYYYWLNPVVIFITYIYGQLDVVSMALTFFSIFVLLRGPILLSALLFAAAVSSKFHVILLIPFICAYIWNNDFAKLAVKKISAWLGVVFAGSLLGFLPLIFANQGLYASAGSPEANRLFAAKLVFDGHTEIYLGLLLVLTVLGRLCLSTRISREGLIYGCGALMGILVLATNPMPGWYMWVLPFLALFFSQYRSASVAVFATLILNYITYFAILPLVPVPLLLQNLLFTALQCSLLACIVFLFILGLKHNAPLKNRLRPLLIGLSGDSSSGKSHLSDSISKVFSASNLLVLEGDDYHKWERGDKRYDKLTHLDPQANQLKAMRDHAEEISRGKPVVKPMYDHTSGRFTPPRLLSPTKALLIQGLHSLYLKDMRETFDLKIFIAPTESVRRAWKILRDVNERGYSLEKVLASIESREQDALKHISPQQAKSDWIIQYDTSDSFDPATITDKSQIPLLLNYIVDNDAPVGRLLDALIDRGNCQVETDVHFDDIDRMRIRISGHPSASVIDDIAKLVFPSIRQITRSRTAPVFQAGYDGINQLFFLSLLEAKQNLAGST